MNDLYTPEARETLFIEKLQALASIDYALIRITETMMDKSIIDASQIIRDILEQSDLISYNEISQGQKIISSSQVLSDFGWVVEKCSFYRPKTKSGDPRFWIYNLKSYAKLGTLIYFTVIDSSLITIPLKSIETINKYGGEILKNEKLKPNLTQLIDKIKILNKQVWIPSVGVGKPADKDVGVTLEEALNIPINSLKTPDFLGEIELKCKRTKSKTRNNLFAQVPNWDLSKYSSAKDYLINYGIYSPKHPEYKTLYVTVKSQPPNQQGFYFDLDYKIGQLHQKRIYNNVIEKMCAWEFSKLRERLHEKHPKTLWIEAEEKIIDGKVHFKYHNIKLTQKPIFSSFLNLISTSEISMDWTHRCLPNGTKYNDHGFLFKIPTKSRSKLFSITNEIVI